VKVDGKMSKECYLRAMDDCYVRFAAKQVRQYHHRNDEQHQYGVTSQRHHAVKASLVSHART
jgi:3-hydroxy-3-methylglutaryl CoA synthase